MNFIGTTHGKYLIVKENNGNVMEVNTKNDAGPDDWEDWRLLLEFTLKDTGWKLEGVVDVETGILTPLEPNGWGDVYKLIFDTDTTFFGRGVLNLLGGKCEIDYRTNNINVLVIILTDANNIFDELLYVKYLNSVYYFSFQDNKLMLFFNELNYLLFKLIES